MKSILRATPDIIAIGLAYVVALVLRFGLHIPERNLRAFVPVAVVAVALNTMLLVLYNSYRNGQRPLADSITNVIMASVLGTLLTTTVPYLARFTAFPRSLFLLAFPIQILFLSLSQWLFSRAEVDTTNVRRIGLFGESGDLAMSYVRLAGTAYPSADVEVFLEFPHGGVAWDSLDHVVILPDLDRTTTQAVQTACILNNVRCTLIPKPADLLLTRAAVAHIGDAPALEARQFEFSSGYAFVKRTTDLLGALVVGMLMLPVIVLACIAVKASNCHGPVIYSQERVGFQGRIFTLYKFRTMVPGAEDQTGPAFSSEEDSRVTPVGYWLRRTHIDELPQLWNVIRGDMSLIGPRPERPHFVKAFLEETPLYKLRHNVRPGLAGLAQLVGRYGTDHRLKLNHDLLYVAYASPVLDLKILLLTLRLVVFPRSSELQSGSLLGIEWSNLGIDL